MSDHGSNGTNDEDICVDNSDIRTPTHEPDDVQTLKLETKIPAQGNFGRPRKHPYKPGKYKCDYCDVMCSKPSVLKKHLRAHTNERPYPCTICKRSFKTKSNLSKHMKSKSHSSKVPSSKEKASLMLLALSGGDSESLKANTESMENIEYDCIEKHASVENSPVTSCDERSVVSDDNSTEESLKRVGISEHSRDNKEEAPDNELSSCSAMLTINSQSGPITVEVEIKLETMKQLQHGLSNMAIKKCSPSPSSSSMISRNDADVRAAESILHMANQRHVDACSVSTENRASPVSFESKLVAPKEEHRRMESTEPTETFIPTNTRNHEYGIFPPKPLKASSLSYNPKPLGRSRAANKSIPNEDQKKLKKCLMESLLKKMQRKTDRSVKPVEPTNTTSGPHYYNSNSITESEADSTQSHSNSMVTNVMPNKKAFNINSNSSPYKLISDSKTPTFVSINSNSTKQTMILQRTIPVTSRVSNCPTSLPSNPAIYLLSSLQDPKQNPKRQNSPISSPGLNSHQRVYPQTIGCNITTQTQITSPMATTPPLHSVKEESIIPHREESVSPQNTPSTDDYENQSNNQHPSIATSQESETGSSPRLCIVEDAMDMEESGDNKKSAESDEEIDVVNTDSDDNDSSIKRISARGISVTMHKKRKGTRESESDLMECEAKRLKETEKTVTLHAPNINAKDLIQDCPLNLSANRQSIIPSCPQTPQTSGSVLENIYRPMVTSANTTSATTAESNIAALTNTNPAHPHSLRDTPIINVSLASNGHPLDYPIFEDKVRCEVCSQMIEPSRLQLHKSMHIYTDGKDQQSPNNNAHKTGLESIVPKQVFNKPRTYRCVVCNTGFRVMGHLSKHHKSKSHLQGLVSSGLLSKALNAKIEESKVPIGEVIDQKTGNIIPDVLSRYLSDWSKPSTDSDSG